MRMVRVVVADESQARFFDAGGDSRRMTSVGTLVDPAARKREQELVSDRPGSSVGSGGGHFGFANRTSHKAHVVESFARLIVDRLAADVRTGGVEALALIAAPRFLGTLRKALSPALRELVRHEVHHDLVHRSEGEIRAHLPERL